jgi:hypothetical protein
VSTVEKSVSDLPRHQCLIYSGAPSTQLHALAATIRQKLKANWRCLYLNSPPMVAGIGLALTAAGVDVEYERQKGSLLLVSDQSHLKDGRFDPDIMLARLRGEITGAQEDGYVGLWASGDMTWEFGPERDFSKLIEYERGLEALFRSHPTLSGVCQYHMDMMPDEAVRHGLSLHPAVYVNETLSHLNAQYMAAE